MDSRVLNKRAHAANLVIVEVPVEISLLQTYNYYFCFNLGLYSVSTWMNDIFLALDELV